MSGWGAEGSALFLDFVANEAAHSCATHGANGAAASQYGTAYGTRTGPHGNGFFTLGHASTAAGKQYDGSQRNHMGCDGQMKTGTLGHGALSCG